MDVEDDTWQQQAQVLINETNNKKRSHEEANTSEFAINYAAGDETVALCEMNQILLELPREVQAIFANYQAEHRMVVLNSYLNWHLGRLPQSMQSELQQETEGKDNYTRFLRLKSMLGSWIDGSWGENDL